MPVRGERRGRRTSMWGVLAVGVVGVVLNLVDRGVRGRLAPSDAAPLLLAFGAGAELVRGTRRRMLRAGAAVVLVVAGLAAGIPAVAGLVRGGSADRTGLVLGGIVVAVLAVCCAGPAAQLSERRAARA
ncbi:hypothetical protein [Streptomyces sp. NPDC002187]|uniref:hypothetical protein n=1 Tax=Streptomyces sp. NPDC002187 TaxID=3364637 RepID=UPI0036D14656